MFKPDRLQGIAALGVLIASLAIIPVRSALAQDVPQYVPGELLVGFRNAAMTRVPNAARPFAQTDLFAVAQNASTGVGTVVGVQNTLRVARIQVRSGVSLDSAAAQLRRDPTVAYVEPNYIRHAFATPNDVQFIKQFAPQKTQANLAWNFWTPQAQTIIAVVDTGVDYTHPDLTGKLLKSGATVVGYNAFDQSANAQDDHGHGTHCSGIAAADTNNGQGIAGIAGWNPNLPNSSDAIKVMPVKVLDKTGNGSDAGVADGITWATNHGAKVISLSLGGTSTSTTLSNAVSYAITNGVVVVAAAGNSGNAVLNYPAALPNVISVAATDSNDKLASYSTYGSWVKVAAPGSSILSTLKGGTYGSMSGTSMACPHVAGEAALLRAHNPTLTVSQVTNLITTNVDPYTPYLAGREIASGAGRINVYRALLAAGTGAPTLQAVSGPSPSPIGGTSGTGTVYLNGIAPSGGVTVALSSDNPNLVVPASVTVPEGQQVATFAVTTSAVPIPTTVTIEGTEGPRLIDASVTVLPPTLTAFSASPTSVAGGLNVTGKVTISNPAPVGGLTIPVTYGSTTAFTTTPTSVTVPAGATTGTFVIGTTPVTAKVSNVVNAVWLGVTKTVTISVIPAALSGIGASPSSLVAGAVCTGKVTLTGPAPAGGIVVALSSNTPSVASVPATVTVLAGASTATFPVTTTPVGANTIVTLSAVYNGVTKTAALTVRPPDLSGFTLSPSSVKGGVSVTGTVTLNGKTAVDTTVTLATTNTAATVPASVIVPAGASTATFTITTVSPGTVKATGTVTATLRTITKSVTLTVNP